MMKKHGVNKQDFEKCWKNIRKVKESLDKLEKEIAKLP